MSILRNLQVLVVDDQESMRRLTRNCLRQMDIERVVEAASGRAAIELLGKQKFDLVISDWIMADMDGLELLKKVRAHPLLKRIPFIMTSTREMDAEVTIALEAGADKYLVKPFHTHALATCIEKLIAARV